MTLVHLAEENLLHGLLGKETGFPSESIVNAFNQRSQTSQLSILQIFHFLTTYCGMMQFSTA